MQVPRSQDDPRALVWKYNEDAFKLLEEYFKKFPKIIECIETGKIVPPEQRY